MADRVEGGVGIGAKIMSNQYTGDYTISIVYEDDPHRTNFGAPRKFLIEFMTPQWLARRMVKLAKLSSNDTVLEPSAGSGRIALAAAEVVGKMNVYCVEREKDLCGNLRAMGFTTVLEADFLHLGSSYYSNMNAVIMNPPFVSKESGRRVDFNHIRQAFTMLAEDRNLVSVLSRQTADSDAFLSWADTNFHSASTETLDHRTFYAEIHGEIAQVPASLFYGTKRVGK